MHGAPELCTIYDAAPKNTITPRPSPIFRIKAPYEYRGVRGGRGGSLAIAVGVLEDHFPVDIVFWLLKLPVGLYGIST